jgi:hypothetical protein
MLMSEPQPSRAKELQAVYRPKIKEAMGLLTGHTTLRAHVFKLRLTQQQDCQRCREKKGSMHIVCHCAALARKRYRTQGHILQKP